MFFQLFSLSLAQLILSTLIIIALLNVNNIHLQAKLVKTKSQATRERMISKATL